MSILLTMHSIPSKHSIMCLKAPAATTPEQMKMLEKQRQENIQQIYKNRTHIDQQYQCSCATITIDKIDVKKIKINE